MNRIAKVAVYTVAGLSALTALIGLAHLPVARPVLALLGSVPGCPVSLDGADPVKTEKLRRSALLRKTGEREPKAMPASIFTLAQMKNDVRRLLASQAVGCEDVRENSVIRCSELKLPSGTVAKEVHLQFDAHDRLVAVDLQSSPGCASDLLENLQQLTDHLEATVGPKTVSHGEARPEFLAEAQFRRVANEFRYKGYNAKLVALRTPSGLRLRQTYQWVPPDGGKS